MTLIINNINHPVKRKMYALLRIEDSWYWSWSNDLILKSSKFKESRPPMSFEIYNLVRKKTSPINFRSVQETKSAIVENLYDFYVYDDRRRKDSFLLKK